MEKQNSDWDDVTEEKESGRWYPSEAIIRFTSRYIQRKIGVNEYDKRQETNKVLDIGCGIGNHSIYFAEQGLDTVGIDISKPAISLARERAEINNLDIEFQVDDATDIAWDDNTFDLVISTGVLDHMGWENADKAINEIARVLKPESTAFLSFISTDDVQMGEGDQIDDKTFKLKDGYEAGMIQRYYDIDDINRLLSEFRIFDIEHYIREFPDEYPVDKSYIQSSQGERMYIDLNDGIESFKRHARWFVAAENAL